MMYCTAGDPNNKGRPSCPASQRGIEGVIKGLNWILCWLSDSELQYWPLVGYTLLILSCFKKLEECFYDDLDYLFCSVQPASILTA